MEEHRRARWGIFDGFHGHATALQIHIRLVLSRSVNDHMAIVLENHLMFNRRYGVFFCIVMLVFAGCMFSYTVMVDFYGKAVEST